jgi:hypothetical protein
LNQVGTAEVKPRRGRPPKVKAEETAKEPEAVVEALKPDVTYTFKSRYKEDVVNLKKAYKERNPDNSTTFFSGYDAEFHRNTWSTQDPELAQLLRDKIKERQNLNPLHIVETTHLDAL